MSMFDKIRQQKLLSFTLLLFTLSVGILIGTLISTGVRAEKGQVATDATPLAIPNPQQLSTAFTQLAKRLEPSVVNITSKYGIDAEKQMSRRRRPAPNQEDEEGMDFFHRFFGPFRDFPQEMPFRRQSGGSGVIVDANGYILTNSHVVENADQIKVRLNGDQKEYDAKLIGTDRETDLAILKIEAGRKLPAAKIGNSDAVQVGDWAVAIGSPFGLEATVTAGIISAKGRDITPQQFQHFIQTDAAINPGNSGGPLLNINGEVIGVNTAIATQSGGYQGVGFALPINTAVKVYNQIIKSGRMTRGSIGVQLNQRADEALLKVYGASHGAFVQGVEPGSPADKAGLKREDVIIAMDGKKIENSDELVNIVADSEVGKTATLTIIRDGQKKDVQVTIGDRMKVWASNPLIAGQQEEEPSSGEGTKAKFGLYVRGLGQADREDLGFEDDGGALITKVDPGSFADDIGLLPNDIVISINRQPVKTVDDIRRIQAALKPGDAVAFHVKRNLGALRGRRSPQWTSFYLAGTLPAKD